MFSVNFCEISKNTFSQRTLPVAASEITIEYSKKLYKIFYFLVFPKGRVYLEPIQISKTELFVKIVNSLMALAIVTKSSISDVWPGSKIATKSCNKSFCEFNIFSFWSHLVKYSFSTYFVNFYIFQHSKRIFKFCCTRLIFIQTNISVKIIHKYANFSLLPR